MTNAESNGQLLINGQWVHGEGPEIESNPPWTDSPVWKGREASTEQVQEAVKYANSSMSEWARCGVDERKSILHRFVESIESHGEELALRIATSSGKPMWEAMTEVKGIIGKLEPSIASQDARASELRPTQGGGRIRMSFLPHGVVCVLGPFNFPVHMPNAHIMPALLAGNSVVLKPSELVPSPAELYAKAFIEAGLPDGVMNLLHGGGKVGSTIAEASGCHAICFTGSTGVGKKLEAIALRDRKLAAIEMGGNSPYVVWDASDVRAAVTIALQSCFVTAGQRCSSARRLVVSNGSFGDRFIDQFIENAKRLRIGLPFDDPQPFYGPLISEPAARRALEWQDRLEGIGGRVLLRSIVSDRCPSLIGPGVVDITETKRALVPDEEIMGPVVTIRRLDSMEEAIIECNTTRFGLAAGLVSENPDYFDLFVNLVRAGVFAWNLPLTGSSAWAPFGGIKESGNYRPTGYLSADYSSRAIGISESSVVQFPANVPPGLDVF